MKEFKFGIWYPIEELELDKRVLFYNGRAEFVGEKLDDEGICFVDDNGESCLKGYEPTHFMPLPPRPGSGE
jgi:hypothetical protein